MQMPEAYIGGAASLFEASGKLNDLTRPFLQAFIDKFAAWLKLNRGV